MQEVHARMNVFMDSKTIGIVLYMFAKKIFQVSFSLVSSIFIVLPSF